MLKRYLMGPSGPSTPREPVGLALESGVQCDRRPSEIKSDRSDSVSTLPLQQKQLHADIITLASSSSASTIDSPPTAPAKLPQNGIRAPRCSQATTAASSRISSAATESNTSSRNAENLLKNSPSMGLPENRDKAESKMSEEVDWQDMEIPKELSMFEEGLPQELRNVMTESLHEQKAMQFSRMQLRKEQSHLSPQSQHTSSPFIADGAPGTSTRSVGSSPVSDYHGRKDSIFSTSQESSTTVDSALADGPLLQPPKGGLAASVNAPSTIDEEGTEVSKSPPSPGSAPPSSPLHHLHIPIPGMTRMEAKFYEKRDRASRSKGLYNLFKGRRTKSPALGGIFSKPEPPPVECISCFDEVPHKNAVDGLTCRHRYCQTCFNQLVTTAILQEETFPPKCCLEEIPKTVMRRYLPPTELEKFDQKTLEYAVPVADRYYCASPECNRWIDARIAVRQESTLECPHCHNKLCVICRGSEHVDNQECPQDYGLNAALEQADQFGWRRCYNCRAMVELNTGCRHITCKCRAEFCYTCGAVWRTCNCTEADQRRREQELETGRTQREAERRAEEEALQRAIAAVEEAERVLRAEREAEEAREQERLAREAEELVQREFERVERIGERYAELRAILDHIGLQQKEAIEKRHFAEDEANDARPLQLDGIVEEKSRQIQDEKRAMLVENEKAVKQLQKKHASALMETFNRHRRDQDGVMDRAGEGDEEQATFILEALLPMQEEERSVLKDQHARELAKWRIRQERGLKKLNTTMRVKMQKMRFAEEEKLAKEIDRINRQQDADMKWFDLLHGLRVDMLGEDGRRLVENGGDIESGDVGKSKEAAPADTSPKSTATSTQQDKPEDAASGTSKDTQTSAPKLSIPAPTTETTPSSTTVNLSPGGSGGGGASSSPASPRHGSPHQLPLQPSTTNALHPGRSCAQPHALYHGVLNSHHIPAHALDAVSLGPPTLRSASPAGSFTSSISSASRERPVAQRARKKWTYRPVPRAATAPGQGGIMHRGRPVMNMGSLARGDKIR